MDYSPWGCRRLRHDLATKLENKDLSLLTYCQNQKALPEEHYSLLQMHQKRKSNTRNHSNIVSQEENNSPNTELKVTEYCNLIQKGCHEETQPIRTRARPPALPLISQHTLFPLHLLRL